MTLFSDTQPCVLLVDDDADMLELTQRLVHGAVPGAQVVVTQSGREAMSYLLESTPGTMDTVPTPDLILLDISMPGMTGFELLQWLRGQPALRDMKVVMLSTSESPADIKRANELGADGYLIKFPQPAVLASVLHEAHRESVSAVDRRRRRPSHSAASPSHEMNKPASRDGNYVAAFTNSATWA